MAARTTGVRTAGNNEIPAKTQAGAGTITPLFKACSHLMLVYNSIDQQWPMSVQDASKELAETMLHINATSWPEKLLTPTTLDTANAWIASVYDLNTQIKAIADANENNDNVVTALDGVKQTIKTVITQSWQLLARFDLELTGISIHNIDPGTAR